MKNHSRLKSIIRKTQREEKTSTVIWAITQVGMFTGTIAFNLLSVFADKFGESTGDFKNIVNLLYTKLDKVPPKEAESEKDNPDAYDEFLLTNVQWENIHTGSITNLPWTVICFDDVISWGVPLPGD